MTNISPMDIFVNVFTVCIKYFSIYLLLNMHPETGVAVEELWGRSSPPQVMKVTAHVRGADSRRLVGGTK